jgi:hypothetical protein
MKKILILIVSLVSSHAFAQLDGWNNGKGVGILAVSAGAEIGSDYRAGTDELTGISRTISSFTLYGSYGIIDDLDISVQLPYVGIDGTSALQDGTVYLKWLPSKSDKHSLGVAVGGSAPLSDYDTDNGLGTIGQQAEVLRTALVGQYNLKNSYFVGGFFQYELKNDPVPSGTLSELRFGRATSELFWEFSTLYQWSDGGKDYRGVGCKEPESFREIGTSYLRFGVKGYKPLNANSGVSLLLTYNSPLRNSDQSVGFFGSYVWKFGAN